MAVADGGTGAVIVVTGASRGLGAGLAATFLAAGHRLGVCSRSQPALPEGPAVVARRLDVVDPDAVEGFAAAVADRFGPIDLWVNNAGVLGPIRPLREAPPGEVATNLQVNVLGVVHGSQSFLRHRSDDAVLVNISSGAASSVYEGWAAYGAAKAAVEQLTAVIVAEEPGLRAYAVSPGVVDTDMQAEIRATSPEHFPQVDRFHDLKQREAYNSPGWVARQLLGLVSGAVRPDTHRWRIPDEPRSG